MANNNIQNFINSCDDMIKGKFIMADNKISKILESIANNEKLYKLVNDCVNGYNFQKEYEKEKHKSIGLKNLEKQFNISRESELISGSNLAKTFHKVM